MSNSNWALGGRARSGKTKAWKRWGNKIRRNKDKEIIEEELKNEK